MRGQASTVLHLEAVTSLGLDHSDKWLSLPVALQASSLFFIHEYFWIELKGSKDVFQPWTEGPLYLANGEAATPIGWGSLTMDLHEHVSTLPVAVLRPKALAIATSQYPLLLIHSSQVVPTTHRKEIMKKTQFSSKSFSSIPPPILSLEPM